MSKKRSRKGKIVKDHEEFIDRKIGFNTIPNSRMRGSGIYALYDNYGLYYVGLTNRSLRSRIIRHTKDHHKDKWIDFHGTKFHESIM